MAVSDLNTIRLPMTSKSSTWLWCTRPVHQQPGTWHDNNNYATSDCRFLLPTAAQTRAFILRSPTHPLIATKSPIPSSRDPQRTRTCTQMQAHAAQIKFTYTLGAVLIQHFSRQHWRGTIHGHEPSTHFRSGTSALAPQDDASTQGKHLRPRRAFRAVPVETRRTRRARCGLVTRRMGFLAARTCTATTLCNFEHRPYGGTHGVFLLSSSGMDVKIRSGVFDFYFLAGSETDPAEVARAVSYAQIASNLHLPRCHICHLVCINARTGFKGPFFLFGLATMGE